MLRDADQHDDDSLAIVLNTFDDHRNAYVFFVNAEGARADGLLTGGSDTPDYGWDGVWDAKAERTPDGWNAEIAIDTRYLQFPTDSDSWGFNISRYIPRGTIRAKWAGISLLYGPLNPQVYGMLDGMNGFQSGARFQLKPYLLVRSDQLNPSSKSVEIGGEAKYNFTPDLSGTLTVNTDFAQTEADSQQINLSRFSVFFPEKRQFFLDGSSLFAFNNGPMNGSINGGFIPYYSRTIGLSNGQTVPINEGMKVTGQVDGLSIGVLGVRTGATYGAPSETLSVARFAYDLTPELQFGMLFTHGDPTGQTKSSFEAADFAWQTRDFLGGHVFRASGWAADSTGQATIQSTRGWGAGIDYPNYIWEAHVHIDTYGSGLNPTLGFLPRPGTRQYWGELGYFPSPASESSSPVNYYIYDERFNQINGLDGHLQSYLGELIFGAADLDGAQFVIHPLREYESLNAPFAIDNNVSVPAGNYAFNRVKLEYTTTKTKRLSATFNLTRGQFYSGVETDAYGQINYALDGQLNIGLTNESVFAKLPWGHFTQRLWQLSGTYSFNPNLSFETFAQYDTAINQLGFNTRLHWTISPDKDLYIVWNRNWRESITAPLQVPDVADALVAKLTWTFSG